ncbi:hypothetical protein SLEP1_g30053 [Rubroshorea leprosula]|uniref:Sulfhydryl oxidase n=1 Tax=Rubroshorea leprosula TaxID=152421 RepID=A0AAV5K7H5_9ROSI|nr:hypothetical protein SLEP1_g30053 [Rubroshorea leprosula]
MSENPNQFQAFFQTLEKVSNDVQTHLSNFMGHIRNPSPVNGKPFFSLSFSPSSKVNPSPNSDAAAHILYKEKSAAPVTKEELGRATWTFLHTLAAQYPENPTRQQRKDVKELMAILSRMYPCKECADHFKEILRYVVNYTHPLPPISLLERMENEVKVRRKEIILENAMFWPNYCANPVQAGSHDQFSQWLCHVHNVVNRSLNKPVFPYERVDARWGKLDCEQRLCDLQGISAKDFGDINI